MSRLRNPRVLTAAAMLAALAVVAGFFKIPITNLVEIRFSILPIAAAGMLFGPGIGAIVGIVSDIGGYLAYPTGPFFPGFTVSSAVTGMIFGFLLYDSGKESSRGPSMPRIALACLLQTAVVGLFLNSLWLGILYGYGFLPAFTARLLKELLTCPVNILLLWAMARPISRLRRAPQ